MSEYTLTPIEPTEQSSIDLQLASMVALSRAGHPDPRKYADPFNKKFVSRGVERLEEHPENYAALVDNYDGAIAAFIKTGIWNRTDQRPFEPPIKRGFDRALTLLGRNEFEEGTVAGIFGLAVHPAFATRIDESWAFGRLLDHAVERAQDGLDTREIRVANFDRRAAGLPFDDVTDAALRSRSFYSYGEFGKVVGIRQELFFREARHRSLTDSIVNPSRSDENLPESS